MTTRLSDVIVPEIFAPYALAPSLVTNRLLGSGAVVADPILDQQLAQGGNTFQMPTFDSLDGADDMEVVTDNPATLIDIEGIGHKVPVAVRLSRAKGFGSMDLVRELIAADPLVAIGARVQSYVDIQRNKTLIATLQGIMNIAGLQSSHVNDLYSDIASPTAANKISASSIIETTSAWGDRIGTNKVLVVHSDVYRQLQLANLITYIPLAENRITIPTFLDMQLLVDDALPVIAGSNSPEYTSFIFDYGAVGFGNYVRPDAVVTERNERAGNGSGEEYLIIRDVNSWHPYGTAYVGTAVGGGPTNTALATGTNWEVAVENTKQIGVAAIKHNL